MEPYIPENLPVAFINWERHVSNKEASVDTCRKDYFFILTVRRIITEYLIAMKKEVWVPKMDAIKLATEDRVHAVIVHLKNGTYYLRPEYKQKPFGTVT